MAAGCFWASRMRTARSTTRPCLASVVDKRGGEYVRSIDGEKLEAMRAERGLSREDLARRAGISATTVSTAERGHRVRGKTAWKVARVFGVHPREMGRPAER
jgi:predicted transcriptional regulator